MHIFFKIHDGVMAYLEIIKRRPEKILPQIYLLFSNLWWGEKIDMEYLLNYFSLAHRLELPAQRFKVFCRRPFLLHLWPERKQEKAEIILFC